MAYRRRTLRGMPPTTRKLARLIGELESVARRGKHLLEEIQTQERMAHALHAASQRGVMVAEHLRAEADAIDHETGAQTDPEYVCPNCGARDPIRGHDTSGGEYCAACETSIEAQP